MVPMSIMAQNTIEELGQIVPKDRLTHDQSWKWSSGTSIDSQVKKELLQACWWWIVFLDGPLLDSTSDYGKCNILF